LATTTLPLSRNTEALAATMLAAVVASTPTMEIREVLFMSVS